MGLLGVLGGGALFGQSIDITDGPSNVNITGNGSAAAPFTPGVSGTGTLAWKSILSALANAEVNISAPSGSITISQSPNAQGNSGVYNSSSNLTFTANGNVNVNAPVTNPGPGLLNFNCTLVSLGDPLALQGSTFNYVNNGPLLSFSNLTNATLGGLSGNRDFALVNDSVAPLALTVGTNSQSTTYSGNISGTGLLDISTGGTIILAGNNTYTGGTILDYGTLTLGAAHALPSAGCLTVNYGTLDIGNFNATTGPVQVVNGNLSGNNGVLSASSYEVLSGCATAILGGGAALTKDTNGTVILYGNNTYAGDTTINAGTLVFNGSTSGLGGNIINNGTLQFEVGIDTGNYNITYANGTTNAGSPTSFGHVISGSGEMIKSGSLTLALSGANTYTGKTTIFDGTINFGAINNFGANPNVILRGGTLQWSATSATVPDISSGLTFGPGVTSTYYGGGGGVIFGVASGNNGGIFPNNVSSTTPGGGTIDLNGRAVTFAGSVSGNTDGTVMTSRPDGKLTLAGANIFSNNLTLASGTLILANPLALQSCNLILNTDGGTLSFDNLASTAIGALSGNEPIILSNSSNGAVALTLGTYTSGNFVESGTVYNDNETFSGTFSGPGSLIKTGSGQLTLTGSSTYTGGTVIDSGGGLQLGDGDTIGSVVGNATVGIVDNGVLAFTPNSTAQIYAGTISGSGTVRFQNINDDGNLTLAAANTYSGDTEVQGGTLIFTGDTAQLKGNLTSNEPSYNVFVVFDQDIDSNFNQTISINGDLIKTGHGNLTLSGVNTFSGNTSINNGVLILGNPLALQYSNVIIYQGGGSLSFGNLPFATLGGLSGNRDIILENNSGSPVMITLNTYSQTSNFSGNLSGNGSLTVTSDFLGSQSSQTFTGTVSYTGTTIVEGGAQLIFAGDTSALTGNITSADNNLNIVIFEQSTDTVLNQTISGHMVLQKMGTGNLTLNAVNTHTGDTVISEGVLKLGNSLALQDSLLAYNGGSINFGNLTAVVLGGLGASQNLALTNAGGAGIALTVGANGYCDGNLSGNGSLTIHEDGNPGDYLTLAGDNTYTGNTTIASGTLYISNPGNFSSTGVGVVDVAAGATLSGSGYVGSITTVNGTLIPGINGGVGVLAFGKDLTLSENATVNLEIGGLTRGTQYGAINISGNLVLGGTLRLTYLNGFAPPLNWSFNFFQVNGGVTGSFSNATSLMNRNFAWDLSRLANTGSISTVAINYNQWATVSNLSGNAAFPAATPFGGGLANLIRYAMNLDLSPTPAFMPVLTMDTTNGAPSMHIQYRVRKNMTDAQVIPQYSSDLVNWLNITPGTISQLRDDDNYTARYEASVPVPANGPIFLRVLVTTVP